MIDDWYCFRKLPHTYIWILLCGQINSQECLLNAHFDKRSERSVNLKRNILYSPCTPKNQRNSLHISALASKRGQTKKTIALYYVKWPQPVNEVHFFLFGHFLDDRAEKCKKKLVGFFWSMGRNQNLLLRFTDL